MNTVSLEASLVNPTDSTEVNVVAAVAAVGTTHRLASGQKITWTADFLREHAQDFIAKPVNIKFDPRGKATEHSRFVVGAIKEAHFDEVKQAIIVTAALWEHYDPKVVSKIRELYANHELNVSMELKYPAGTLIANTDGSYTPTEGMFSGMGFVGQAGDPRSMVYLMAQLADAENVQQETSVNDVIKEIGARLLGTHKEPKDDEFDPDKQDDVNAELSAAHEGSFEWLGRNLQAHLSAGGNPDSPSYQYIIATYPNYAIYQEGADYFRIDYKRSGANVTFGEPQKVDPVYQPTASASAAEGGDNPAAVNTGTTHRGEEDIMSEKTQEELQAAQEQNAELKASLDAMANTLTELKGALQARDAADAARVAEEAATTKATERMAELEKIVPVKDELKAGLLDNLKVVDDAAYEALKATFATSAELRAGIEPASGFENPEHTPGKDQKISAAEKTQFAEEAKAQFGTGSQSEDKE